MRGARPPPSEAIGNFPDSVESKQAKLGESMTERMVEDLHSDVWGIAKSDFRVYTPEEAVKA